MAPNDKRLVLLDGMALVYRAFFVFMRNPRITSSGFNASAVFGYANTVLDILNRQNPTHVAVAFDTAEPTRRHREFQDYKAQREEMPEDLSLSIPHVHELTEALRIPVITCPGYEADDIIGTLAKAAEKEGYETCLVTPDKDFGQLVTERTRLYRPGRMGEDAEILDARKVCEKWGIQRVEQITDIIGLAGDASDNIPGVPGIGEKTAQKLIAQFGTLEDLLRNLDQLKDKQRERLQQYADQAILSKRLAQIDLDVPLAIPLDRLERKKPDVARLKDLFTKFEFRSLGARLFGEAQDAAAPTRRAGTQGLLFAPEPAREPEPPPTPPPPAEVPAFRTLRDVPHDYRLVRTTEERTRLLEALRTRKHFCFDTETTGLDLKNAELVGISFAVEPQAAWYLALPNDRDEATRILEEFRPVFENEAIEKTGQNLKFDLGILRWYGIRVRGRLFDTMLAHILVEPDMRHGMDQMAEAYLKYSPIPFHALVGKDERAKTGKAEASIRDVPVEQVAEYSCEDADITLQLRAVIEPLLQDRGAERVLHEIECPLIPALVEMEYQGIAIDVGALNELSTSLSTEIDSLRRTVFDLAGMEFNLNSPKQLGDVLFETLGLDDEAKRTKTGQYATDEQVLTRLAARHEIARAILDYRNLSKLKSTYVDTLPDAVCRRTGRVHTHYDQLVAATGRLQSYDPNLQNIPVRRERGQEIRKAFVPQNPDYVLLSADYSQIELRIIAALSGDEGMLEAFRRGEDIHGSTASRIYRVAPDRVTPEMRRKAKMVNFGIAYGISAFGLAQRLGISRTEAKDIIQEYFRQYPGIQRYIEQTVISARDRGYVETVTGRRRVIRDINSRNATARGAAERNAINTPIQGSAADMIKVAMVRIHRDLEARQLRTRMLLQIHDELLFDLHRDEKDEVIPLVKQAMTTALPLNVPIEVEVGIGRNWLEAH